MYPRKTMPLLAALLATLRSRPELRGPAIDILIDLNSSRALEYALIIIGGITVISGLSNFLTNFITSLTIQEEFVISGNLVWLYGLIKTLLGIMVIFLAKPLSRMVGSAKDK